MGVYHHIVLFKAANSAQVHGAELFSIEWVSVATEPESHQVGGRLAHWSQLNQRRVMEAITLIVR